MQQQADDQGCNADSENETNIRRGLDVIQSMIDISADRLVGLRTQCATSAELTQQEIRILEAKLVKMFSELLITKAKLPERLPKGLPATGAELRQWLRVVGLSPESLNIVLQRVNTLELLLDKSEQELRSLLNSNVNVREEEIRRLVRAMCNLKRCRQSITVGEAEPTDLYWDSWDRHHHIYHRTATGASPRPIRSAAMSAARHNNKRLNQQNEQVQSPNQISPPEADSNRPQHHHFPYKNHNLHQHILSPEEACGGILTPSPSPPSSPSPSMLMNSSSSKPRKGFPTTPPPHRKHQTLIAHQPHHQQQTVNQPMIVTTSTTTTTTPIVQSYNNSIQNLNELTKSKSHESQLMLSNEMINATTTATMTNAITSTTTTMNSTTALTSSTHNLNNNGNHYPPRTRLHTDPSPENYNDININENLNNLTVPRSPCTPIVNRGMGHMIAHRFTKKFNIISTCDLCNKQMFLGLKCKECKYRCHKDCEIHVPPSCGLPPEFVNEFKRTLIQSEVFLPNNSPNTGRAVGFYPKIFNAMSAGESSSPGSSCNSSTPSSPALNTLIPAPQTPATKFTQFKFPDIASTPQQQRPDLSGSGPVLILSQENNKPMPQPPAPVPHSKQEHHKNQTNLLSVAPKIKMTKPPPEDSGSCTSPSSHNLTITTTISVDSDKTISLSGSTSTSTDSERTPIRVDSLDEHDEHAHWPRQNSVSLKEWDIPFCDLEIMEKIGDGRFGTVHRAQWHGAVAVKILKEDYLDHEAFKLEVATFKKTRHENVVLFMGACIRPQAIVTSLCKGNTLYTHIHTRKDKFNLNKTTMVALQISQGMGYLHARDIVHKDLKTKNIFLENGKVIITDFGLFSATKLQYREGLGLGIPSGWLCYLAPELMQVLKAFRPEKDELPFSKSSDVHAFGTVWYELLCGEFPFKSQAPEAIIFQVGRGMKQTLANLQASRDVKDILMMCWAFEPANRPQFVKLLSLLEKLPKKRLARSPSHPVQLSRSAESVF